jgi:nicotinamidase/pyrazinamidase
MLTFVDVDTQRDFLLPQGALYVLGSVELLPALRCLTSIAQKIDATVVASADAHAPDDPEFVPNGGSFPPHCVTGTPGQQKVSETIVPGAVVVAPEGFSSQDERDCARAARAVVLEKRTFDLFSNPAASEMVEAGDCAVAYGVATEYCVRAAVLGLLSRGIRVQLVTDAVRGIDEEGVRRAVKEMRTAGATLTTTEAILQAARNGKLA